MSTNEYRLTSLLPSSPYLLAYSIPLLLVSLILTYAGAFLTLDRTRSFVPHHDARRTVKFLLEGGVGGLAIGFAFGVHLSTFLSLLVHKPLNSPSFLAIWLLSAVLTTFLAGRWRYAALAFAGITGGTLFALSFAVIIHPSLLPRIIMTVVIMPILTILTLLPFDRIRHNALRFATASTGAAGLVISIALLAGIPSWANVWERYWIQDGLDWGTSKEKALGAAFCLFLLTGALSDWFLKRTFGENPDQKWDSYLANYATNLPDRQGVYEPFVPFWKRAFGGGVATGSKDIIFPPNDDIKLPPYPGTPTKLHKHDPFNPDDSDDDDHFKPSPGFLLKGHTKKGGHARFHARKPKRNRDCPKFRPLRQGELSSDSSSDDDDDWKQPPQANKPWLKQRPSMSSTTTTPTLVGDDKDAKPSKDVPVDVDYEKEIKKLSETKSKRVSAGLGDGEVPDYSDFEDDSKKDKSRNRPDGTQKGKEWSPGFMKKQRSDASQATAVEPLPSSPPLRGVPATPSLIKALDRIAVAQKDAFGPSRSGLPPTREDESEEKKQMDAKWDDFWSGVKSKARDKNS